MAIDPSIALGVKPVQFESPINQMAKMYEMQNMRQSNELNKMKMDEYTRGVAKTEKFNNALAQAKNESDIKNAFISVGDIKGYQDYLEGTAKQAKLGAETSNLGLTGEETKSKILKSKAEHASQLARNLSRDPSDLRVNHHVQEILDSPLYSAEEKAAAQASLPQILAMPYADRQAFLASQGASASDLKPTIQTQNLNDRSVVSSYPAFGGAPTQLSSTQMGISPAEAQRIALDKQRLGLEGQRVALDERRDIVSNQQVSEDGTVTNFNKFGEVIGTVKGVGKPSAQFTKTKEQTKRLNTDLNLAITELENATKDGGLIDQSTGSGLGKAMDVTRAFVTGGAGTGAIAGAKLGPIADLALKMVPRFEGPQSDKDTQSYKEAAGQLANTSIPNEIRKQAGRTVLRLMKNRKNQFVSQDMAQEGVVPSAGGGIDASNPLLN